MKPPFKISWEEVTPAKAQEWLEKFNTGNRNLRATTVESFAIDMKRGAWSQSHQGIAFASGGGRLLDGQHRLAAIVRSGVTIWFLICRDVPDRIGEAKGSVMDSIDRGNTRSVADVLKLSHGYKANAVIVTAACWNIAGLVMRGTWNNRHKLSVSSVLSIAERFRNGLGFVEQNRPKTVGLRAAPIGAAVAFAYDVAPNKTKEFYKSLISGVGLDAESPILVLRNLILNEGITRSSSRQDRYELTELVLHTLYCFINKKEMPRAPKPGARPGVDWFLNHQPENIRFLASLFPSLDKEASVVTAKDVKLTPAAERILRDQAISDRDRPRSKGAIARMQARIERGELEAPIR